MKIVRIVSREFDDAGQAGVRVNRQEAVAVARLEEHDRLFAEVSHWPHAVAFALGAAIGRGDLADRAIEFSGGGLRDTSRIAASSPELWAGILLDNADAVLESAERYRDELARIVAAIERRDRAGLLESLETASRWRRRRG